MEFYLKSIDELYQYLHIKEYISIYINEKGEYTDKHIISKIVSNKPNYQLHCANHSIITMAYSYIPRHIQFIIKNNTLIKIVNNNNAEFSKKIPLLQNKQSTPHVNIKNDQYNYDYKNDYSNQIPIYNNINNNINDINNDEKTEDTSYSD